MFEMLVEKAVDLLAGRFTEAKKEKDEKRALVQQVQAACDTRAVYTAMHAQLNVEAMFAALIATRRKLQELKSKFTDADQQQRVADVIGELDAIERWREGLTSDWDGGSKAINASKIRIIELVRELSKSVELPYALPTNLTQDFFGEVDQAIAPAATGQSQ